MPTQMPPSGPHTEVSSVQSIVQMPFPTPPGSVGSADRLSVGLMQVNPAPQSAFVLHASPRFIETGVVPPEPPVPTLPPVPAVPIPVGDVPPAPARPASDG